jgi:hypothetical protein
MTGPLVPVGILNLIGAFVGIPITDSTFSSNAAGPVKHRLAGESEQSRADKGAIALRSVMAQETCCTRRSARRKFDSREPFPGYPILPGF